LPRRIKGLDLWMAVRVAGAGNHAGGGTLESVLACSACGGDLTRRGDELACACGNRLAQSDGLWVFAR
jgi:hypothetical protein